MINYSKALTKEDIELLNNAIPSLEELWGPHGMYGNTAFIEGDDKCTIWLRIKQINDWQYHSNNTGVKTFINVIEKYMSEVYDNTSLNIGKAYIYRLKPGKEIPRHIDVNDQPYFLICNRYQLFINIPDNVSIESVPEPKENTFFWFNHHIMHHYNNNGTEDLLFCVVDTYPNITKDQLLAHLRQCGKIKW